MTGKIFDIHRLSTHDGPGMRTTVFMKGCSLKCTWCHNPESIQGYDEIQWLHNKCIVCGACIQACGYDALTMAEDGRIVINRDKCTRCMDCVKACPTGAMNRLGQGRTVEEVFEEVMQDKLFYENSGGGLTVSGGEPLLQYSYVAELLNRAKTEGIHTAVDTSLQVSKASIDAVLPYVDLWLVDRKETDPVRQKAYLGTTSERMDENLAYLLARLEETDLHKPEIWIRTPLIPGATARDENITEIGRTLVELNSPNISKWELCLFNNLCGDKYKKLDLQWEFDGVPLMTKEDKEHFLMIAIQACGESTLDIKISGMTG